MESQPNQPTTEMIPAETVQKKQECKRAGCRNHNVRVFTINLSGQTGPLADWAGKLCPKHIAVAYDFLDNLFASTKEYDDGTTDEPTND